MLFRGHRRRLAGGEHDQFDLVGTVVEEVDEFGAGNQVVAAGVVLQDQAAGQAVPGQVDHVPPRLFEQRLLQPLAGGAVLQHPQLDRLVVHLRDPLHQPGQLVPFPAEVQGARSLGEAEHRQHPQPLADRFLRHLSAGVVRGRQLVDDHVHPVLGQGPPVHPGQLPRQVPQHGRVRRQLQPHRLPVLREDRRDRAQHVGGYPLADRGDQLPLVFEQAIRGRVPPQVPAQVRERLELPFPGVQLDRMISDESTGGVRQAEPPARRTREVQHLKPHDTTSPTRS